MNTETPYQPPQQPFVQRTVISDIDIPFGRMVVLILKAMIASIPALICFYLMLAIIGLIFMMAFGGIGAIVHALQNAQTPPVR